MSTKFNPATATTLQTFRAEIDGKFVIVNEMKQRGGRQQDDLYYTVNGKVMTNDKFWSKNPVILN
jgi:hypothetical protein